MSTRRPPNRTAACGLVLGLVLLSAAADLAAADRVKEAQKYTEDLRTSKDPKVRATALTELGKLGQIQKGLVASARDDMFKALEDKNAVVRAAAAHAVGMIDPDPKEAVPVLLKLAKEDKEESVRVAAIQGLGAMGPSAREAAKDLREIVQANKEKKNKVSKAAQTALRSINQKKP
jgi:HEAT repeat protein